MYCAGQVENLFDSMDGRLVHVQDFYWSAKLTIPQLFLGKPFSDESQDCTASFYRVRRTCCQSSPKMLQVMPSLKPQIQLTLIDA